MAYDAGDVPGADVGLPIAVDVGKLDRRVVLHLIPRANVGPSRPADRRRGKARSRGEIADDAVDVSTADVGFAIAVDVGELDGRVILRLVPRAGVGPRRPGGVRGGKARRSSIERKRHRWERAAPGNVARN